METIKLNTGKIVRVGHLEAHGIIERGEGVIHRKGIRKSPKDKALRSGKPKQKGRGKKKRGGGYKTK